MTRERRPKAASQVLLAKGEREECTAHLRARALAIVLSALAAGTWDPTPGTLDELSLLGWTVVSDIEMEMAS